MREWAMVYLLGRAERGQAQLLNGIAFPDRPLAGISGR
jgi:hypothetical protein